MKFFSSYREIRFWNKSICSGLDVSLINIDPTLELFWQTEKLHVNTTNCCYRLIKRVYRGAFSIVLFHSAESLSKASAAWAERLSSSVRVSMRSAPFGWAYSHWPKGYSNNLISRTECFSSSKWQISILIHSWIIGCISHSGPCNQICWKTRVWRWLEVKKHFFYSAVYKVLEFFIKVLQLLERA